VPKNTRWDRHLSVAADGDGMIGHAGALLLRKLADQCGLMSALTAALTRAGKFPLFDRGVALVSMAVAIGPGATSMSDVALLDHQGWSSGRRRRTRRYGPCAGPLGSTDCAAGPEEDRCRSPVGPRHS
jgi:hypothetical protein